MLRLAGPASKSAQRYEALLAAEGIGGENFPRAAATAGTIMVSGTIYYLAIGLVAGDVVTNLLVYGSAGGSGFSGVGVKLGLYSRALARLAVTGDVSASFGALGAKTCPLSAAYTVPATAAYLMAVMCISSAPPTLYRSVAAANNQNGFGGGSPLSMFATQTSQTDLPDPATLGGTNISYWGGWS